jgi:prepilin-type N-terminal cleavage/methylation domain-containing protein
MRRAFTIIEIMIVVVIFGLLVAMAVPACQKVMNSHPQSDYELWCKLERRTDITFEEWNQLRAAGLLPHTTR